MGIAEIIAKKEEKIYLGNLEAKRDWGIKDYVNANNLLQHKEADDFVLSTGKTYSVKEFLETAFSCVNIEIKWQGKGLNEKGIDKNCVILHFGRNR